MKLERLGKVVQKELLRSPKKTAVLASISLVAIYFWVPLVWKWLSPTSSDASVAARSSPAGVTVPPNIAAAQTGARSNDNVVGRNTRRYDWRDLLQWMEHDPQMSPARLSDDVRNPFQATGRPSIGAATQVMLPDDGDSTQEMTNQPPLEYSPQQLGLRLSSTLIGARGRVAVINGKVYREDDQIVVAVAGSASQEVAGGAGRQIEFVLTEIQPHQVLMNRNGTSFSLPLERPKLAGNDQMFLNELPVGQN